MTDQSRSKLGAYKSNYAGISRRDVLRAGTTIIPASIILPAWLTANAQTAPTTFDYYIGPRAGIDTNPDGVAAGVDTNAGTLAAPFAITSLRTNNANFSKFNGTGKRIGILPGTYDLSALSIADPVIGAIQMPGGNSTNVNYLASANASGMYSPRTATLDIKGASGKYGGVNNNEGVLLAHTCEYGVGSGSNGLPGVVVNYAQGYLTIDGLRFTGFEYKGVRIGGASAVDGPTITNPVVVQNCEFFGGGFNPGDELDNCAALWLDGSTNCVTATNNYFHDSAAPAANNGGHFNAIIVWGAGALCKGTTITYNTCVNAGNIFGKEGGISGTIVRNNYVDISNETAGGASGIQDFTGNFAGGANVGSLTGTTYIQNNIVVAVGGSAGTLDTLGGLSTLQVSPVTVGWMTPAVISNNTVICTSGSGATLAVAQCDAGTIAVGAIQYWNNIYAHPGGSGGANEPFNYLANPAALAVFDYNLNPSSGTIQWLVSGNSSLGGGKTYTSYSAFAAAIAAGGGISGAEAHSILGAPTFTNTGTYAAKYQLAAGSVGKGAGSTNGRSSGSATDMGAWGNGATQIGCNFAAPAGTAVPNAPALTVS
jgi:hypothetical protein